MINFRKITEENFDAIIKMKRPEGEGFVASNAVSLAQCWQQFDGVAALLQPMIDNETTD